MRQAGEQAAYEAGVPGLPAEIIKTLGRLKFRTSYGQNVLNHVVETSQLAAVIAAEIGADVQVAKMGGLLHDIGKAVDHEVEGPHAAIGAQIAQRHNLPSKVINGIAAHHQEVEYACLEAPIVQIADAISASDRVPAASRWRPTSSGSRTSGDRRELQRRREAHSPSRPVARCASSCGPRRSTT